MKKGAETRPLRMVVNSPLAGCVPEAGRCCSYFVENWWLLAICRGSGHSSKKSADGTQDGLGGTAAANEGPIDGGILAPVAAAIQSGSQNG